MDVILNKDPSRDSQAPLGEALKLTLSSLPSCWGWQRHPGLVTPFPAAATACPRPVPQAGPAESSASDLHLPVLLSHLPETQPSALPPSACKPLLATHCLQDGVQTLQPGTQDFPNRPQLLPLPPQTTRSQSHWIYHYSQSLPSLVTTLPSAEMRAECFSGILPAIPFLRRACCWKRTMLWGQNDFDSVSSSATTRYEGPGYFNSPP